MIRGIHSLALAASILLLVPAAYAMMPAQGGGYAPHFQEILWQNPGAPKPCTGGVVAQAIGYPSLAAMGSDCPTWLVILPSTEGGNFTAELSFYESHRSQFVGAILDDYQFGGKAESQAYVSLDDPSVCPLLYAWKPQPSETIGASCLILAVGPADGGSISNLPGSQDQMPVSAWRTTFDNLLGRIEARSVTLLAYGAQFTYWRFPVPSSYLSAALCMGPVVIWH
jgi:hypothetical protein